ncbi:MAG: TetR family transcriptional regulator [Micromonosporaceae bacterium]|nr:TetR family transcriptional regulator [Micromonosporaceae bacterium]
MRRLGRAERREQILAAATAAFARGGYAATSLDDIATEAGITRVILYRHFDSKTDLYQAVLDRFCDLLAGNVTERTGGFTEASLAGLLRAAAAEPAGFRLLFHHAAREPQFRARADQVRREITEAALVQIAAVVPDQAWARWAAQLAPTVAIEAITAWLDAGRPDPASVVERVRQLVVGVVTAAAQSGVDCDTQRPDHPTRSGGEP